MRQGIDRRPIRWTPRALRLGRTGAMVATVLATGTGMFLVSALALLTAPGGVR